MKNKITIALLAITSGFLLTACNTAPRRDIILVKSTVFGFDVSADAQTQVPHVRLGLIRNFYQIIPVAMSTSNSVATVETPNYATSMTADMGLTSQQGSEEFATGNAADLQTKSNTTAQIGAAKLRAVATVLSPSAAIAPAISTNAP